jgi:hypothetical protein
MQANMSANQDLAMVHSSSFSGANAPVAGTVLFDLARDHGPEGPPHSTSNSTIYNPLARHGWRKLMPRPFHPRRDRVARQYFKKADFHAR